VCVNGVPNPNILLLTARSVKGVTR
jgi:hypothetical protein